MTLQLFDLVLAETKLLHPSQWVLLKVQPINN